MPMTQENATWFAKTFSMIVENVGLALLGKEEVIRLALTAMLAEVIKYLMILNFIYLMIGVKKKLNQVKKLKRILKH